MPAKLKKLFERLDPAILDAINNPEKAQKNCPHRNANTTNALPAPIISVGLPKNLRFFWGKQEFGVWGDRDFSKDPGPGFVVQFLTPETREQV